LLPGACAAENNNKAAPSFLPRAPGTLDIDNAKIFELIPFP
jgi:hypothetical protein